MERQSKPRSYNTSLTLLLTGAGIVALSIWAEPLKLDFTPGFGVMQIVGLLIGITLMTAAGYIYFAYRRPPSQKRSLLADVGIRLGLTGLLACYVAGLADMVGVGTHQASSFQRPFLGPLQQIGLVIGLLGVAGGLLLCWLGGRAQAQEDPEQG